MKSIIRLSLALIMFSLFSISYLVTSAFAQEGAGGATTTGDPCMVVPAGPDRDACYATTPPPNGMAPAGTPEGGGISGWIKGGLKALGIGSEPDVNPAGVPVTGAGMSPTGVATEGTPGTPPMGDPCMVVPAGPDRDACYATTPPKGEARTEAPGGPSPKGEARTEAPGGPRS
jgi:hypothetical protein